MSVESLIQIKLQLEASGDQATADKIGAALDKIAVKEEKLAILSAKRTKALADGDTEAVTKIEAAIAREIAARDRLERKTTADFRAKEAKESELLAEALGQAATELEKLAEAQEKAAETGEKNNEALEKQATSTKSAGLNFTDLAQLATGVNAGLELVKKGFEFVGGAIDKVGEKTKEIVDFDRLITTLSKSTGITKEGVAAVTQELVKLGESPEQAKGGLSQFVGFLSDALNNKLGESAKMAKLLGIDLDSLKGVANPVDLALKQVSGSLQGQTNSIQQASAAAKAFGEDDAPKFVAALKDINGSIAEVQKRKLILSPEESKVVEDITAKLGVAKETIQGLFTQVIAKTFPVIQNGLKDIQSGLDSITDEQLNSLKDGVVVVAQAVQGVTQFFIDLGKVGVAVGADLGDTLSALASPVDTLKTLLGFTVVQLNKTGDATGNAAKQFGIAAKAGTELEAALAKINDEQSKFLGLFEARGNAELANFETLVKKGLATEADLQAKRAEFAKKAAHEKEIELTDSINKTTDAINTEDALRRTSIEENLKDLKRFGEEKAKLSKEYDQEKAASDVKNAASPALIAKREELNQLKALEENNAKALAGILSDSERDQRTALASLTAFKIGEKLNEIAELDKIEGKSRNQDAANLSEKKKHLDEISRAEEQAAAKTQGLRDNLDRLRKATNVNELVDETKLTEEEIKLRKALLDNKTKGLEISVQKEKASQEEIAASIAGADSARDKSLQANLARETVQTNTLKDELAARQVNQQQYDSAVEALSISRLTKDLEAETSRLKKLKETQAEGSQLIVESTQKVGELVGQIKDKQRAKDLQDLQNDLANQTAAAQEIANTRLTYIEQEKTAIAQKIAIQGDSIDKEKLFIEQQRLSISETIAQRQNLQDQLPILEKQLSLLQAQGASQEVQKVKITEIAKLRADISQQYERQLEEEKRLQAEQIQETIEGLSSYSNELAKSTEAADAFYKKLKDGDLTIKSIQQTFDGTSKSVEEVQKHIKDLIADAQDLFLVNLNAAQSFTDAAEALQKDLDKRLATEAQKVAAENLARAIQEQQQRIALAQKTAESLAKIERDASNKLRDLKHQEVEDLARNNQDKINENTDYQGKVKDLETKGATDRKTLSDSINAQILTDEQKANAQRLEEEAQFQDKKNELTSKATSDRNSIERKGLVDQASIEDQLKKLGSSDPAKKKELEQQLKDSLEATARAKRKEAEIKKAEEESGSKEELDARTSAIEEKYRTEEEGAKQLADLQKLGNQEAINRLKQLLAEEAANEAKALSDKLASIAREAALKQKALDDETKAKKDALNKQLSDFDTNLVNEKKSLEDAHKQRLSDIATQSEEIRKKYTEEREKILTDEKNALADLAKSAGLARNAFFDLLDGAEDRAKKLAEALKVVNKAFTDLPQAGAGGGSGSGSPSSGGNGNGNSGGNGVNVGATSPNGSTPSNSDSFSTGLQSANVIKQPPKNADSGQGAGAGTSKTGGQQPGSTGAPSPSTTSPSSVEALVAALTKLYQDFKGAATTDKVNAINKTVIDLITATAQNLKLKIVNGSLVLNDGTSASIAGSIAARISPAIYNQRKGLFKKGIEDLVANFADAMPTDTKGDDQEGDTGDGKLAKGGDFNTPGGVKQGQGGGTINTGNTTSRTIVTTQPTAKKPDGRDPLRIADNEATKGANQGIDDLSAGNFAGSAFANVKGSIQNPEDAIAGKKAAPPSPTTPPGGASVVPNMPVSIGKAIERVIVNVNMPAGSTIPQLGSGILAALIKELQDNPSAGQQLNQSLNNSSGLANLMMFGAGAIGT